MGQDDRYRNVPRREAVAPNPPPTVDPVYTSGSSGLAALSAQALGQTPAASASGASSAAALPPPRVVIQGRRFLPPAESMPAADSYVVKSGDRIDILAAKLLGDPLLYWQIADANDAVDVTTLCQPGVTLRIPSPTASVGAARAAAVMFAAADPGLVEEGS